MAGRMTVVALVAVASALSLTACGPDFLADNVKTFSDATKKGSDAVNRMADTFGTTEGALTLDYVANKNQQLTFDPAGCRANPALATCGIAATPGKISLIPDASEKLLVVQYYDLVSKYADDLSQLLETKNADALGNLQKSVSSTITAISSIGPIGGAVTTVVFTAANAIDDAARLARVRQAILAAQKPIQDATSFVTGYPDSTGKPTRKSLMIEFQGTVVDGAVTDLNNHVRNYNVIPRGDGFATQRRLALESIVSRARGVAQLKSVNLQQLALDTLAAHDSLARSAKEGRMTVKELMSAVELLYKRATAIKDAVDKMTGH